ncbi:MAG: DUF1826 domain-containing protein [Rickettsiales bacterium]|jgi:hypothetical protein|nr:DUF1826 domain-containing protein [Rickettsiales bacterium]
MSALAKATLWQDNCYFVSQPEKLDIIRERHINLAVWQRPVDPTMLPIIHWLAKEPFELEYKTDVEDVSQSLHKHITAPLEFEQSRYRLIADIKRLAVMFADYAVTRYVRLIVESVHDVPCPKFHQDNVPLRLICTYAGAGTEWLENSNVNTHADCCGGSMVRDTSRIQQLKPFEVALMKGKLWPKNDIGIYHRSPKPDANQPRLVVKMDVAD